VVTGIFTERDLLTRVVGMGLDLGTTQVGEVMTPDVAMASSDLTLGLVSQIFEKRGFRHIPVVASRRLVGVVSMRDLFRVRLQHIEALLDQEVCTLREMRALLQMGADERVTVLMHVNERLSQLALTDELTGLYNYRYFMRRLEEEVSRLHRVGRGLALLFADIDHFKLVNDTHGHAVGDTVLRHVAAVLRASIEGDGVVVHLRRSDVVARYGGEEFAILLPECHKDGATLVAERIRRRIEDAPAQLDDGTTVGVTVSLGVACVPDHGEQADQLLAAADRALYLAKEGGRNRTVTCGD
jgi:diguanylate cyclase (GGDEF)-like protein